MAALVLHFVQFIESVDHTGGRRPIANETESAKAGSKAERGFSFRFARASTLTKALRDMLLGSLVLLVRIQCARLTSDLLFPQDPGQVGSLQA